MTTLARARRELLMRARELDDRRELLECMLDLMDDPCMVVNEAGVPILWNRAARPHVNRGEETRSILSWSGEFWYPGGEPMDILETPLARAVRKGESARGVVFYARFANSPDVVRRLRVSASCVTVSTGRVSMVTWHELDQM